MYPVLSNLPYKLDASTVTSKAETPLRVQPKEISKGFQPRSSGPALQTVEPIVKVGPEASNTRKWQSAGYDRVTVCLRFPGDVLFLVL